MAQYDRLFGNPGYIAKQITADTSSPAAIPRHNGEPVFNEPWESRIFGAAVALCERGFFQWDEFRERLISEIASADASARADAHPPRAYYENFLSALERLLVEKGVCAGEDIERRINAETADEHHHGG